MDNFTTIYFTEDYEPSDEEISYFEKALNVEISMGSDNYINVYTKDKDTIQDLVDLIGDFHIQEIAA